METKKVWMQDVAINKIERGDNVRLEEDVGSLMLSIERQGLLEPIGLITSKSHKDKYLLVFGYRRLAACEKLGWGNIPAKISDIKFNSEAEMDKYLTFTNLTENTYEKPDPVEQGRKYIELADKYKMSVGEIHALTGKSEASIKDDMYVFKHIPEKHKKDVTRTIVGRTAREGKLPVTVVKSLIDKARQYNMNAENTEKMWDYVKTNEVPAGKLQIISEIMNRLGIGWDKAVALSEHARELHIQYIINTKVEQELMASHKGQSMTTIMRRIIRGEIPAVKNLIMIKPDDKAEA